jgi:hypothetical protein
LIDNAVYSLLNKILTALNNKAKANGIFLILRKLLIVSTTSFLDELEIYTIAGISKNLYSQYLRDRYQRVFLTDNLTHCNLVSN